MNLKATLCFSLVCLAGIAFADRVTLKSGSFLTGTAGKIQDGVLKFKSDDLGDLDIKIASIEDLDVETQHVVKYVDGTFETKKLRILKGALTENGDPLNMANVKATDPVEEMWHGSVNVAYQAARGNTYQNTGSVIANVNRRWEKDRLNFDIGYYYGENGKVDGETEKTTDRWEAELKHDHFWLPKVYHYEDLKYDRDMIQNLMGRYRVGLGGGYQWLDNSTFESTGAWSFNQELGLNWIKEEYDGESDAKENGYCALRYGHHLTYVPKWATGVNIFHNAEILPETDEWEKFLAKADIGVSTKIVMDFDLLAKIEWDYNSKPANDRKKDDVRYIVGLGYKW